MEKVSPYGLLQVHLRGWILVTTQQIYEVDYQ